MINDSIIIITLVAINIINLHMLFVTKGSREIIPHNKFIITNFSKFLNNLNKMFMFNMNPSGMTNNNHRWMKFSYLINYKIFHNKSNKMTLKLFYIKL